MCTFARLLPLLSIPLICTLVAFLYWPGLWGPFLLDDIPNILPARADSLDVPELIACMLSNGSGYLGRVVPALTFAINTATSNLDPYIFKLTNIGLHLIAGLLATWFLGLLLDREKPKSNPLHWHIAILVALTWMLHPLLVSTVLYVVQRMTILSAIFSLAALITYTTARQEIINKGKSEILLLWTLTPGFIILSCLSKENGVLTICAILLTERLISTCTPKPRPRSLIIFLTLFCILPTLALIIYLTANLSELTTAYISRPFSLVERLMTQANALTFYIEETIIPNPLKMSLYHDDFPITRSIDIQTSINISLHLCLITLAIIFKKRRPVASFGILWFYCWHSMESSVLPLELVYEHRSYIASLGLLLTTIDLAIEATQKTRPLSRSIAAMAGLLLIGLLAFQTYTRASMWGDEYLFANLTVERQPRSHRANVQMINILLREGRVHDARTSISHLTTITPWEAGPWLQLLYTYCLESAWPENPINHAETLLKSGIITPFTLETLKAIQDAYFAGQCPAASSDKLLMLTGLTVKNPTNIYPFQSHFLHARFLANNSQMESAKYHFRAAFNSNAPLATRTPALVQLALLEMENHDFIAAHKTIQELASLKKNPAFKAADTTTSLEFMLAQKIEQSGLMRPHSEN